MDGCKLIIEYEVDCTFEFPDENNDKNGIAILDREPEISKGKIRHSLPDIYLNTMPISIQFCNQIRGRAFEVGLPDSGKTVAEVSPRV